MDRRIARLSIAAVLLALSVSARGQQSSPPSVTFQTEVNYVDVDAIVTDAAGRFVGNLTKDDFQLFEDGKPQKVDMFSTVEIPLQRPDRFAVLNRPISSDVRTNREAFAGRVYVIVLDDLDISPMRTAQTRKQAREFVEKYFGANDVAAVIYTSGRSDAAQEFTSDAQLLLAAIEKFSGRRMRPATLDKIDQYYQKLAAAVSTTDPANGSPDGAGASSLVVTNMDTGPSITRKSTDMTDPTDFERSHRAMGVLTTLKNLSDYLAAVRGRRKAVIMLSEGVNKGRITLQRFVEVCCQNPAKIFGLYPQKGAIALGSDGDLVIVDLERRRTVTRDMINSSTGWSIYEGWEIKGWPVMTILRGHVIMEWPDDEAKPKILGRPIGRYVPRELATS